MFKDIAFIIIVLTIFSSCISNNDETFVRNTEARDDSIKLQDALNEQFKFKNTVYANVETEAMDGNSDWDTADDPAIWYNAEDPSKSLIIGTNKKSGIYTYDLSGKIIQKFEGTLPNNVDIRDSVLVSEDSFKTIVAYSNRDSNTVDILEIDREEVKLIEKPLCKIQSGLEEVYGFCLYYNKIEAKLYAFVNGKSGDIEQWQVNFEDKGEVSYELVKSMSVKTQPEGMVADDETGKLYVGEEEKNIHIFKALPNDDTLSTILPRTTDKESFISYDIEGLSIITKSPFEKYLIASIQGNFSYALYDLNNDNAYVGSFIIQSKTIDGVEETDGLEVCTKPLPNFPDGILVVQDGFNKEDTASIPQNFKIVSLTQVYKFIN